MEVFRSIITILIVLAVAGWFYLLWEWFIGDWDVSRTYSRCEGCLGIIRPGERIWRHHSKVYHYQCL